MRLSSDIGTVCRSERGTSAKAALGGSVRGERDLQGVGVLDRQAQCPQLTGTRTSCTADNARADNDGHDYPLSPGDDLVCSLVVWV